MHIIINSIQTRIEMKKEIRSVGLRIFSEKEPKGFVAGLALHGGERGLTGSCKILGS